MKELSKQLMIMKKCSDHSRDYLGSLFTKKSFLDIHEQRLNTYICVTVKHTNTSSIVLATPKRKTTCQKCT